MCLATKKQRKKDEMTGRTILVLRGKTRRGMMNGRREGAKRKKKNPTGVETFYFLFLAGLSVCLLAFVNLVLCRLMWVVHVEE